MILLGLIVIVIRSARSGCSTKISKMCIRDRVWWLRSPHYYCLYYSFCAVSASGSLAYYTAYNAYGVVPGFVV